MSGIKHTPGPWKVGKFKSTVIADSKEGLEISGDYGKDAFDYYGGNLIAESVSVANAKLIASTPDLLEALKSIADIAKNTGEDMIEARLIAQSAILKAEGNE